MPDKAFLIVRIAAIGDVVLTTPLLNRIRSEHPDAHVTWLCGSGVTGLVKLFAGVNEIIDVDETALLTGHALARARAIVGVWRRLVTKRFDRVLLLHPDSRYRVLLWPLRGVPIHAARHPPAPDANPIPGRFRGDESARLLDGAFSTGPIVRRYGLLDIRERLPAAQESRLPGPHRVVLVPGGARNVLRQDTLRRWPVESYKSLAAALIAAGAEVVLVGDERDREHGRQFDTMGVRNRIGATTLEETLQIMRDADLVVTHDTGPLHLARLVRTPIVALFGPTDPAQFVGADPLVTVLWGGSDLACRPCYDGKNFAKCADNVCINRIAVDEVFAAVQRRLAMALEPLGPSAQH